LPSLPKKNLGFGFTKVCPPAIEGLSIPVLQAVPDEIKERRRAVHRNGRHGLHNFQELQHAGAENLELLHALRRKAPF